MSATAAVSHSMMDLNTLISSSYLSQRRYLEYLSAENQYLLREEKHRPVMPLQRTSYDSLHLFLGDFVPVANEQPSIEDYTQPDKALPELPIELWNIIIDHATYVPGAYDVHDYSAIAAFMSDSRGICIRSRFESALRIKLSLSLVCKRLNAIAQHFLFEHVRISSGTQAIAVAGALKQRRDAGKRSRRIDLALEGSHDWTKKHTKAMISIFKSCPNLVCLSTAFCDPDPRVYSLSDLIESLAQHKNIKRIEVKAQKDVIRSIETSLQNLQVLWLIPTGQPRFWVHEDVQKCHLLPKLRALILSDQFRSVGWNLETPNLRAYIIERNAVPIVPNMEQAGIEYLSFPAAASTILPNLSAWSSLQTLSVKYIELATRRIDWQKDVQLPTLQCIVVEEVASHLWFRTNREYLEENLERIISPDMFPNLRCVKIHLSFIKDDMAESEPAIRWQWLRSCVDRGLRLEMLQGNMERSANEWKVLSRDRLNDVLFPPGYAMMENLVECLQYEATKGEGP